MAESTPEFLHHCWIQDYVTKEYIEFQLMPDEVVHSKSVNWSDQEIMGRAFPLKGYSNSNARAVALTLIFAKDLGLTNGDRNNKVDVKKVSDWFMSFTYPDYSDGLIKPPHPVFLNIGKMIVMKGVMRDVTVTWRGPWHYASYQGVLCEVSFSVEEVGGVSTDRSAIVAGNYGFDWHDNKFSGQIGSLS